MKTFGLYKGKDPKVFTAPGMVSNREFDVEVFSDVPGGVMKRTHCPKVRTQVRTQVTYLERSRDKCVKCGPTSSFAALTRFLCWDQVKTIQRMYMMVF